MKDKKKELLRRRKELDASKYGTDESPIYMHYQHPRRYFTIDCPNHWKTLHDKKDNSVKLLHPKRKEISIAFYQMPFSIDTTLLFENDKYEEAMTTLLEKAQSTNIRQDPNLYYPCMTGDIPDGLGQRWSLAHEDLVMGISAQFPSDEAHIFRPLIDRMLSSFRIDRKLEGLTIRTLMKVVSRVNEACPDAKFKVSGNKIRSERMEFSVDNLVSMIQRTPYAEERIVDEYISSLIDVVRKQASIGKESWEDVRDRLLPMIRPDSLIQAHTIQKGGENEEQRMPRLIHYPWLADLIVCYAVDDEKTFRMVNDMDLERWKTTESELHERAMVNLTARPFPEVIGAEGSSGKVETAVMGSVSSSSSFLLHPQLFTYLSPKMGDRIWAAIPGRDSIVLFAQTPSLRSLLQNAVGRDFATTNHAISDRLFTLTMDGVALA